jgi:hypothetical protein
MIALIRFVAKPRRRSAPIVDRWTAAAAVRPQAQYYGNFWGGSARRLTQRGG